MAAALRLAKAAMTRIGGKPVSLGEAGHVNDFFRSAILFPQQGGLGAGTDTQQLLLALLVTVQERQPVCREAPPRAPDMAVKHPWYFSLHPAAQLGAFGRAQSAAFPSRVLLLPVRSQGPN